MSQSKQGPSLPRSARELRSERAAWRHLPFLTGMIAATALVTIHWMAQGAPLSLFTGAVAASLASTAWIAYSIVCMGSRVHFDKAQGAAIMSYFLATMAVVATTGYGDSKYFPMLAVPLLWLTTVGERMHTKGALFGAANVLLLPVLDSHWHVAAAARIEYASVAMFVMVVLSVVCLPCNHMVRYMRFRRDHAQVEALTATTRVPAMEASEAFEPSGWLLPHGA